ncbi:rod shape-determining protein MreC [Thalassobacillus sp. CUG 92003]|uniref:rod shape-determining protein MreC n=1 Tax=Thalassobacillus sp. CUG 92003 TaxID=2736641 RepID=UPI0015E7B9C4|nr:rod shape-determining protein MreC [Thalassobacillus sp. CUG 92003]
MIFRKKRLIMILISLIILVALVGLSLGDRGEKTMPEKFLHDTVGWTQNIFGKPVRFVNGAVDHFQELYDVHEQNQVLKSRLTENRNLLAENQRLKERNQELRSVIDKAETRSDYEPIHATVIARSSERWFQQMTINQGESDGIEQNMAVITGEGMVGKIQSVSEFHSTVKLLSGFDRSNRISSWVVKEGEDTENGFGLIEGFDEESERLLLKEIPFEDEVKKGETVISSGLGGVFPEELEIGVIDEVENDEYGLTQIAYVKPSANLYNINHVIVVNRSMETVESENGESEEEGS